MSAIPKLRKHLTAVLPLWLGVVLQVMPLLRTVRALETPGLASSSWALVWKVGLGAVALLGFEAISSASSLSISPPTAYAGVPYTGTITFISAYEGKIASMTLTNVCLSSPLMIVPGLTAVYNGFNTATVTGTPTAAGAFSFTIEMWQQSCGSTNSGYIDTRKATLTVVPPTTPPSWLIVPYNMVAQAGSSVGLSAAASGPPSPAYAWLQGRAHLSFRQVAATSSAVPEGQPIIARR